MRADDDLVDTLTNPIRSADRMLKNAASSMEAAGMKATNFMKSMSKKRLMGAMSPKPMPMKPKMDVTPPDMEKKKKKMMGGASGMGGM